VLLLSRAGQSSQPPVAGHTSSPGMCMYMGRPRVTEAEVVLHLARAGKSFVRSKRADSWVARSFERTAGNQVVNA
jgi:hypothetical protein